MSHVKTQDHAPQLNRRSEPRCAIQQRCFVSTPGNATPEPWRCIAYNVSASGIGVLLPIRLQVGAILQIEPWQLPGAPVLRAEVKYAKRLEYVWMTGCRLAAPLDETQLRAWCRSKSE